MLQLHSDNKLRDTVTTFLAHVSALTITCCPSSVSRARFVTAGAIDLKLCTYVPVGEMTLQTNFRSDQILACFVTAGSIDLKLCTYVPLGHLTTDQISVRSDSLLGHQGAKTENTKSAVTPQLMAGWIISKFLS
jgi:hypothetical protein